MTEDGFLHPGSLVWVPPPRGRVSGCGSRVGTGGGVTHRGV